MSKASQRRQAEQRKRATEVRGSPEKRLRLLFEQDLRWESPVRFWKECVKHLPADPVLPSTEALQQAIEKAKPLIDVAAAHWPQLFDESDEDPDEILPGILLPFSTHSEHGPTFHCTPLSVFGRAVSEESDLMAVMKKDLPDEFDGALWVFGSVLTARGETFVLAAHREGAVTAAVRVAGQWIDRVPTFTAGPAAHETASLMVDNQGTEAITLIGAARLPDEDWSNFENRSTLLRSTTSNAQTPYLRAMWRMVINQMASEASEDLRGEIKTYLSEMMGEHRRARKAGPDGEALRVQLDASRARERELQQELQQARQQSSFASVTGSSAPFAASAAQRLAGIF